MVNLSFKNFVWPRNPSRYQILSRRIPRYNSAGTFTGLGPLLQTVCGQGEFTGKDAFQQFKNLQALVSEASPGTLRHPILGSCNAYLTELTITQEPLENYVAYAFTFQAADNSGKIPGRILAASDSTAVLLNS